MAIELQHLRRRLRSIAQIQKVTSAMQKVSSARFMLDRLTLMDGGRYTEELTRVVQAVLAAADAERGSQSHIVPEKIGGAALLCFGSERGLCGGFNNMLVEQLHRFVKARPSARLNITVVGTMLALKLRRSGFAIDRSVPQPAREDRTPLLSSIAADFMGKFREGTYREIYLLFMTYVSAARQVPTVALLLPPPPGNLSVIKPYPGAYEPSPADIADQLLPEYVRQQVTMAFLHSVTSENAARQSAMNRATNNAGELVADLKLAYTRVRQETITAEMLELVQDGFAQ